MKAPRPPRLLVPAIAASQFAPPFMVSGVAVALPALGADLGAGATALSLVETLFLAASAALLLPAGRLSDAADKAALYKVVLAVQGVGFAFFSSPNMATVMNAVARSESGIASALSATARSLGMVSGMLIVAALVSVNLGHEPVGADPARYIATMRAAFWILAGVSAVALTVSSLRPR